MSPLPPLHIGIDPGEEALAWVLGFGRIQAAGMALDLSPAKLGEAFGQIFSGTWPAIQGVPQVHVWVEFMFQRGGQAPHIAMRKAKDLLDLQFLGGAVAGAILALCPGASVTPITYHRWAGSFAEKQVQARVLQTLDSDEVCVLDAKRWPGEIRHNLYDAAGIFLYATGRLRPGRTLKDPRP